MKNVHFAIPEIYGETLSYYDLLRKLVNKTNELIDNYNTVPEQIAEAVANLDASQLFSEVLNQLIHSIATDNTKSANAVKVYKKHDLLYATFNKTVNLYESLIDFSTGTGTELIPGTNIREVNISELFIELRKLIDVNKNNIEAVTAVANGNSTEIAAIHNVITAIENKNTEQDNEISTLRTMISSPYNFKGDVASISALPASGEVNDTYYVQDVKYKVTWTGSAWVQSSLSEADYQTELSELKSDLVDLIEITTNAETSWVEVGEHLDGVQVQANKSGTHVTLASASGYKAKKLIISNEKFLKLTFNASDNVQYGVGYFCTTLDGQILSRYNTENYGTYTVEIEVSALPSGTQVIYVNNNASAMVPNIESRETERLLKSYTKDETDSMILLNDMYPLMFSRLAVIGDSLSSGELVYKNESGEWIYEDRYGNSWLSYLAREYGASARTHYAAGGMTCKRWLDDYTAKFNLDAPFNAYFIALGTNDAYKKPYELGTIDDAVGSNTFVGYYKQIVELVRVKAPNAVIFCVSNYSGNKESQYNQMIQSISELYDGCFYVDLVNKADLSLADGGVFVSGSHFTTLGYIRIARNIAHLVNEIVVENGEWFKFFALNNSVGDKFND